MIDTTETNVDKAMLAIEELLPPLRHLRGDQAVTYGLNLLVMELHLFNGQLRQMLRLKSVNESLAERVAKQSELLTKKARKPRTKP